MNGVTSSENPMSTGAALVSPTSVEVPVGISLGASPADLATGLARQIAAARVIQESLLPKDLPPLPGFGLAGFCRSAGALGGDFYDAVALPDDRVLLVIADVMGTGVPAALFAASLRMLVRSMAERVPCPSELLTWINEQLFLELSAVDMFITTQLALVDTKRSVLRVASAGHCPFLLATTQGQTQALEPEGLPLGIQRLACFTEVVFPLSEFACGAMYTDGLTETFDGQGNLFGQERLEAYLSESALQTLDAAEARECLLQAVRQFQGQTTTQDDLTLIVLARETGISLGTHQDRIRAG